MKILIVGAGAIGGYFGGRLLEKGADVTFLVREKRHKQLKENGLVVSSIHGDLHFPDPQTIGAESQAELYDVILVSTKSYHLDGAIESIRPYVGDRTIILPLLNGIAHLDALTEAFGPEKVIGGLCFIETTLDESGKVIQTSPIQDLVFGELNGKRSERILKLQAAFDGTKANFRLSEKIEQEMWQKYLFITSLSGITSLFRSPIGPIRDQTQGAETIKRLLHETVEIMTAIGAPLSEGAKDATWNRLNEIGHGMKSSLQRDMEKSLPTEGDHLFGYLLKKAAELRIDAPTLSAVYANVDIYDSLLSS
ncbi:MULTISPECIES: ketopantoate reductase family protein [unclassified Mesobacillus]|uniref:ketopantoate reductase family protein n=1 Tax=unclassified Mesobacillus TaxID=2675270 RepID=UPI00203BAA74|nr:MULTISPECIES: ketopantoate reductase family protein [unclassified Mesobacillus]MCM3124637.1 ketopantoate reductase family protein [Mesobacillus sp. MER 33]MCM3234653.1 ketopantoate reductase family protein [Mesobacillus sp. MER 48]